MAVCRVKKAPRGRRTPGRPGRRSPFMVRSHAEAAIVRDYGLDELDEWWRLPNRRRDSVCMNGHSMPEVNEGAEPRPALDCPMTIRLQFESQWLASSEAER